SYTLTPAELAGLTISSPDVGSLNLTMVATETDTVSGTSAQNAPATLTVNVLPIAVAPVLAPLVATGNVGSPIGLTIAVPADADPNAHLSSVTLGNVPSDAVVMSGNTVLTGTNGSYTLTPDQLAGLTISSPDVGSLTLTMVATETDPVSNTSAQNAPATLTVNVLPVAVAPTLAPLAVTGNVGSPIGLSIAVPADADPNAHLSSVTLGNVPSDAVLMSGNTVLTGTNGSYTLTPDQLAGLTISSPDVGSLTLTMVATETDPVSNTSAQNAPATLTVNVLPVAVAPTLAPLAVTGNVGSPIGLSIAVPADADPNAHLSSVTLGNVPSDAVLMSGNTVLTGTNGSY